MTQDELQENGKELAGKITDLVNYSGGQGQEAFLEQMSREHRTLQQSFTRMCLQWLEQVAERKGPQFLDARNEASQKITSQMMEGFIKQVAFERNIPTEDIKNNWEIYKPSKWLPHI